jgi:two-component system, OmpR family, KDP operon response regulator KdpE
MEPRLSSPSSPGRRDSVSEGEAAAQSDRSEGKILIVDDDASVRRSLHTTLLNMGFEIAEASGGEEAIELCRIIKYDAVLLDINMPGKSGIETCGELRTMRPRLAILMVSVSDDHERKVKALEAGADDYVIKPFHIRELTARIRAALRRTRTTTATPEIEDVITIGDLSLNPARRLVQKAGVEIHLTPKEFDLLHYLMANRGLPVTHARLLHAVWGPQYVSQVEYLRSFVRQLRRKLNDDAAHPRYLLTENHIGYRFADPADRPFLKRY